MVATILKQLYCQHCKRATWHTNGYCNVCGKEVEHAERKGLRPLLGHRNANRPGK